MSFNDQSLLAGDPTFQARVKVALTQVCLAVIGETVTPNDEGGVPIQLHVARMRFSAQVLNAIYSGNWAQTFAIGVATDATTIAAVTQNGSIALTPSNVAAQGLLATDGDLFNAIVAQFNSYLTLV